MRRPDRPLVIDAPTDRRIFETYVETQLAATLMPGDVVVLDNLPAHKSAAAEQAVRAKGAWLLLGPSQNPLQPERGHCTSYGVGGCQLHRSRRFVRD